MLVLKIKPFLAENTKFSVLSAEFTLVDINGRAITDESKGLLLYNGGTVCDDSFSDNSGTAICREMGYDRQSSWESTTTWTIQSNYDIVLDDVRCDSGEWSSCSYTNQHNCGHSEDVFLACQGKFRPFVSVCKIQMSSR